MPSGIADYGSQTWLGGMFGITDPVTEYWVALLTDEPGEDMDGDVLGDLEPDDSSYARVSYPIGDAFWYADSGFITNTQDVVFPTPAGDWGYLNHFALCTDQTSGDLFAWGEFLNPQYVTANFSMVIPAGSLTITMSSLDNSIAP